jgi:type VI secretion system secreted protein Hcp
MFKKLVATVLASSIVLAASGASATGETGFIRVIGQKTDIKSGLREKGREDMIQVTAMSHSIVSPRDPQSGLPTGQRMHKPFVFTKEIDRTSPQFWSVLTTNENLSSVTLKVWVPAAGAAVTELAAPAAYTVKLTNANIASIDFRMIKGADGKDRMYEEIAMTYQKIDWTWTAGPTATDSWEKRI